MQKCFSPTHMMNFADSPNAKYVAQLGYSNPPVNFISLAISSQFVVDLLYTFFVLISINDDIRILIYYWL